MDTHDMGDLDFTKAGRTADNTPVAPETVTPDTAIGRGKGNYISYARRAAGRPAAAADAPVLVVDDDEDTLRLLERVLTLEGFTVRTAADGMQFAQALRKRPLPRLVLLDVELPKINGFRLLSLLRQHPQTAAIPVVMVTARTENKDLMQGLSLGADGYLSKPLSVAALRAVIEKVMPRPA